MSEIQLTKEQRQAVENRGGSLLVSAAAGSGKTKVLVERLFDHITREGAELTDFLIITYTKAAAAELRSKIASELSKRLAAAPENAHLRRQTMLVYKADIKTVDAFCTQLLRENTHLLGSDGDKSSLTPDFRVLDENEAETLREKTLGRALEDFYSDVDEKAGKALLADTIGAGRDDRALASLVLDFYGKLQSHAYPEKWLEREEKRWKDIPDDAGDTDWGKELLGRAKASADYWRSALTRAAEDMRGDEKLQKAYASQFLSAAGDFAGFEAAADKGWDAAAKSSVVFPRLGAYRGESEVKTRAKAVWDACKTRWPKTFEHVNADGAALAADMRDMAPAMLALFNLTRDFSALYAREKLRINAADFSDQEHFAVRILENPDGEPTETGRAVAERYCEIMVDEYQDTNEIQNRIFSAVSKNGKNLFMVGDVKQSIYRFRLADPTIFLHKYETYPPCSEASEGEDRKLTLSANFRSRRGILDAANFVFSNIMSREMGEMAYTDDEALHFGAGYYEETGEHAAEFDLLDYPSHRGAADDCEEDADRAEAEARFTASRARALIDEKFPVRDDSSGKMRAVRQEDIVVLMRSPAPKRLLYERVFAEQGLTCSIEASDDFFSAMEVAVIFSMLKIIDNPHQDVPLISVLRSPLFGFAPDRLAKIRAKTSGGDFYEALRADGGDDAERFVSELSELRAIAPDYSVHRLIWHVYNRFGVLGVFGAMEDGKERRENLTAFYEYARKYESEGYRGLFRFVSHLEKLIECGQQPSPAAKRAGDGIRLMSIHKSKGLEFPIVILADADKKFNDTDLRAPVLVHPKLGAGPMHVDAKRRVRWSTLARDAVAARLSREMKSEEMRVLYVAMTRAKEKLIIVSSVINAGRYLARLAPDAACPAAPEAVASCDSYSKWILLALLTRPEAAALREAAGISPELSAADGEWQISLTAADKYMKRPKRTLRAPEAEKTEGGGADTDIISFAYPFSREVATPSKMTATQLKGREIDREIAEDTVQPRPRFGFGKPHFLEGERALTGAERGTAIHAAMQFLDFSRAGTYEGVQSEIERMRLSHLLSDAQAEAVSARDITELMTSPLGEELRGTPPDMIRREFRFSMLVPAKELASGIASDDKILLQGAVDCFFERDGKITVVDFKSDAIRRGEEAERAKLYEGQIAAYAGALEKLTEKPVVRKILYFFATGTAYIL